MTGDVILDFKSTLTALSCTTQLQTETHLNTEKSKVHAARLPRPVEGECKKRSKALEEVNKWTLSYDLLMFYSIFMYSAVGKDEKQHHLA